MSPRLSRVLGGGINGVHFLLREVGSDVVMTYEGRLDLTGATFVRDASYASGAIGVVNPTTGGIIGSAASKAYTAYAVLPQASFGSGGSRIGDTASGDVVGLDRQSSPAQDFVAVPDGYVSLAPLSGEVTFLSETFASLGITPGAYVTEMDISGGANPNQKIHVKAI